MKPRLRALLLHGMGNTFEWWAPFLPPMREMGVEACALALPDLETEGPDAWVDAVGQRLDSSPTLLIGHSLGAAAALMAAVRFRVGGIIAVAMPSVWPNIVPSIPSSSTLSATALARIAVFLMRVAELSLPEYIVDRISLTGENDTLTDGAVLEGRGFRRVVVKNTGHEVNESFEGREALARCIADSSIAAQTLDPALRLAAMGPERDLRNLHLDAAAPPPVRLDVEITSRCNLRCRYCARTIYRCNTKGRNMTIELFSDILDNCASCDEVVFVGLGEPMLHPDVAGFVALAQGRGMRTWMVTNGTLADTSVLRSLKEAGLEEMTFSIDAAGEPLFGELRGNASFETVAAHLAEARNFFTISIFTALSKENAGELAALIDLAASLQLPALTVSDLNFPENRGSSCAAFPQGRVIDHAVRHAREKEILLLGPHIHDYPTVKAALRRCLIASHKDIVNRPPRHTHCLAPWRIAVVGAGGEVFPCNCAPNTAAGTVRRKPFDLLWNGEVMRKWRTHLINNRNEYCGTCPRY